MSKDDSPKKKYPIAGYAPGNYMCNCVICKQQFIGDKRAIHCEPCAVKITKKESKEETLEEAAEKYINKQLFDFGDLTDIAEHQVKQSFINGAKWQTEQFFKDEAIQTLEKGLKIILQKQETMYSEEEVLELLHKRMIHTLGDNYEERTSIKWFEQIKKKFK